MGSKEMGRENNVNSEKMPKKYLLYYFLQC